MENLYCPRCEKLVEIEVRATRETYDVRGEQIEIDAQVAYCLACHEQIFHEGLDSKNLDKVYHEFRRRRGVLTPEEIRDLRKKYGLSQRALGRLLRLGEITIHRYENGSLPSDAHNELLVLMENPANVKRLLDGVGSDLSVNEEEKLRKRLDDLLTADVHRIFLESAQALLGDYKPSVFSGFRAFNPETIREMSVYISSKVRGLSKTKLMKLFFYSDFYHFKQHGRSISGLRYAHLPYGPGADGWNTLLTWLEQERDISLTPTVQEWELITPLREVEAGVLRTEELNTVSLIVDKFGHLSASELSKISHMEKAYTETTTGELISYEYALELSF